MKYYKKVAVVFCLLCITRCVNSTGPETVEVNADNVTVASDKITFSGSLTIKKHWDSVDDIEYVIYKEGTDASRPICKGTGTSYLFSILFDPSRAVMYDMSFSTCSYSDSAGWADSSFSLSGTLITTEQLSGLSAGDVIEHSIYVN